jgi:hypothetical protein
MEGWKSGRLEGCDDFSLSAAGRPIPPFFQASILPGVVLLLLLTAPLAAAPAAEPAGKTEAKGPLAGLPSAPGAHLAKVKTLGDGHWLKLGAPKPDPERGVAYGPAYTYRMAFAPDLRGAFLYGEGAHATFRKDGYVQDGLWFYDMNAHAWICCYPGTNAADAGLRLNADGWWQDKDGGLVPVTVMHGWDQVAYDPDRGLFAAVKKSSYYSMPKIKGLDSGGKDLKKISDNGLWLWDTRTARWSPHRGKGPKVVFGANLVYLPGPKKFWYWCGTGQIHLYDCGKKSWGALKPAGPRPPFTMQGQCAYDPKRDRVYLGGGGTEKTAKNTECLWIYDVKGNSWTNAKAAGSKYKTWGCNGTAVANYDTVGDRLVMFHFAARTVNVYDPDKNAWSSGPLEAKIDAGDRSRVRLSGFYDPETNAHYFHAASVSRTDNAIWVYRHRKAGGQQAARERPAGEQERGER